MTKDDFIALLRKNYKKMLLTKKEASGEIGISSATLDRLRKDGKIKSTAIGGQIFFRIDDLAEFLQVS